MERQFTQHPVVTGKWSLLSLVLLIGLGLGGNFFSYELFFSIQVIFGSIFALLALQLFGFRRGVAAAFLISLITYPLWNHPYAIVIMTAEVATVGLLCRRWGLGVVLADALYWLALGIPLVIIFYNGVMDLPFYNTAVTMLKQALNGIANALAARLLFMVIRHRLGQPGYSLRELAFSLLVLFVLLPSLLLLALQSRAELQTTELKVHQALELDVQRLGRVIDSWLESHLNMVEHLAWSASRQPLPLLQLALAHVQVGEGDFLRLGLLDQAGQVVAVSPLADASGRRNLGGDGAAPPFIAESKRTLQPLLSEVVVGQSGKPMVMAVAPVLNQGAYAGCVTGVLDLDRVRTMVVSAMQAAALPGVQFVLLDKNGRVVVSSRPELPPLALYRYPDGIQEDLGAGISRWTPHRVKNVSISERWKSAQYLIERQVGGNAEWRLLLAQPLAPFQQQLYERYAWLLAWLFAILLAALGLAELVSREFVASLEKLQGISTGIPAKLVAGGEILWPESSILEIQALADNYRALTQALIRQFGEIREMNATLEGRVEERTWELQESEAHHRAIVKTAMDGFWVADLQGRLLEVNASYCRMIGYSEAELLAMGIGDVEVIESAADITAHVGKIMTQGEDRFETRHRRKDGSIVDVEVSSQYRNTADGGRFVAFLHDISERKREEAALKQSHSLLKSALQATGDGILVVANDGRITEFNAQFAKMWRLPLPLLELHDDQQALAAAAAQLRDPQQFLAKVRELYATPAANSFDVLEFTDGRVFERYSQPQRIDGQPVGRVWSFHDVSEQRRAGQALRASEEKFRSIFNSIGSGVAVIGKEMEVISLNPLMQQWFPHIDTSKQHICYQSFNTPPRAEPCSYCPTIRTLRDGQIHTAETDTPTPEGVRHYLITSSPLLAEDGSVYAAIEMVQDVTESKEVALALAASEERFRAITATAADAVILIDELGRITYWNPAAERLFGYGAEEVRGRELHLLIAPARFHQAYQSGFAHFVATGEGPVLGKTLELAALRKDGSEFPLEVTISALHLEGRRHALGLIRDITERKQTEAALQESEQKYRELVEAANSVILRWAVDGTINYINEFGARFFGFTPAELVGRNVLGTIVPKVESSGRDLEEMIRGIEADPLRYRANENENLTKDGRRVWLRWENRAITDPSGALTGILSIGYDITERKEADQALRESEERFRTLFENAAMAVFIHDENGLLLEANRKALADNGLATVAELRARDFWMPEPYSLNDALGWLRKAAEEGPQHFEWRDRDRQGRQCWRDMTLERTILNGQPRIIAIALDITERKQAEAQLQSKTAQLEELTKTLELRVQEEVALRLKNEQILMQQSKLAAMGETLGAIAHQWRQPLNSLGLIIQNLQDAQAFGELNEKAVGETVEKSMAQIRHMSKTIDDFRNFFQPDKEKAVFDAMLAASEVLALFAAQLQANGISYRLNCQPCKQVHDNLTEPVTCPAALVLGYRNEFEHVLLNLVNNARDAILARREGGVSPGGPGLLVIDFSNRDGMVYIAVGDNGGGLDPAVLLRVFEPYFTTKEQAKGTGLGLYMSKVIIEDHMDGTIAAANGEGGAVFTIALPWAEAGRSA